MVAPDTYEAYLSEISRYLQSSQAFEGELRRLGRDEVDDERSADLRAKQEIERLKKQVQKAEKSYEETSRMLAGDGLRGAGALIPARVHPVSGDDSLSELLARHSALTSQIERLARRYINEKSSDATSAQRASQALRARHSVLQARAVEEEEEQASVETLPARVSGCLSHVAVLIVGLAGVGSLLLVLI